MDNLNSGVEKELPQPIDTGVPPKEPPNLAFQNNEIHENEGINRHTTPHISPTPPAINQGWYKKLTEERSNRISHPGTELGNAAIYSMVANNPLQKPDEIIKPTPKAPQIFTPTPITNPLPRRSRMFNYNPYQQMRAGGMY